MKKSFSPARLLSVALHPVLMPFITLLLLLKFHTYIAGLLPVRQIFMLSAVILITTVICPLLMIWFFYRLRAVESLLMEKRQERTFPLLITAVFFYLTYYMLKGTGVSALFSYFLLGSTLLIVLCLFINFFFKISLHMAGIGGMTGFWTGLCIRQGTPHEFLIAGLLLACGLLAYARMTEGKHSATEVISGLLLGAGLMYLLMMI
jgi:hypothetical protein